MRYAGAAPRATAKLDTGGFSLESHGQHSPALSVILLTPDRYGSLRKTIRHLRAQSIHDQLEIVIVAPSAAGLEADASELNDFQQFRIVEIGPLTSTGPAYAAGVRHASAAVVVLGEDHSFPEPGWAQALLNAHRQPWAVVGPAVKNANPATLMSWADFLMGYGPWMDPVPAGEAEHLPGHNSAYKREVLLGYGQLLSSMMEAESILHWDLRRKGHRLYLEPAAKTRHVNFTLFSSWVRALFRSGRKFAAFRAANENWPMSRRLLFAVAAPAIPIVRFARIVSELRRPARPRHILPKVAPALLFGLAVDGAAQMIGYALGAASAHEQILCFEFYRYRHVRKQDRPTEAV